MFLIGFAGAAGLLVGAASAQDQNPRPLLAENAFGGEFGLRTWFSTGRTAKDLYDFDGTSLISRLTYEGLDAGSAEAFGEIDLYRAFLKGNAGLGAIFDGNLQDEDFEPYIFPYSSTDSSQKDGSLSYATVDLGLYLFNGETVKLGGFAGYNWLHQEVDAFGCEQTAGSFVCDPAIASSIAVISQDNDWQSLRLGINGSLAIGDRFELSGEAAWLPVVSLDGADSHHLRICEDFGCFTGPIPEDGRGDGYQLEGMLQYRIGERISLGLGGRYWHMQTSGDTHFEDRVIGLNTAAQPVDWSVDIYGVLAQAKIRF